MGRALSYKPNAEIKSKQTFVGAVTLAQNANLDITITSVNTDKSKLFGSNNGLSGESHNNYYRMFYFTSGTNVRGITRNSNGASSNGYVRYSIDVVEYY
jgi:hypothetical protein